MGIDVYARWRNQTEAERKGQITGFATDAGNIGYLREGYHGGPYVTKFLMPEGHNPEEYGLSDMVKMKDGTVKKRDELTQQEKDARWDQNTYTMIGVQIPASILRERLPIAVMMAMFREFTVYGNGTKEPWMVSFEELEKDGGKDFITVVLNNMKDDSHAEMAVKIKPEMIELANKMIENKQLPDCAQSFVDFVVLCETQEKKYGEPCFIYVSA